MEEAWQKNCYDSPCMVSVMALNAHLMLLLKRHNKVSGFMVHTWSNSTLLCTVCSWYVFVFYVFDSCPRMRHVQHIVLKDLMHCERQEKDLWARVICLGRKSEDLWINVIFSTHFLHLPFSCWVVCHLTKQQHFWDLKYSQGLQTSKKINTGK